MARTAGRRALSAPHAWLNPVGRIALVGALAALIAVLPLPLAAVLLIGGVLAALALHDPVFAVGAAILSVPVQELVQLPGGLSVTQACLLLGLASLGVRALANPERPLPFGTLFGPLAIFVWWLGVSASLTPFSRSEGLRETLRWSTVLLIYLLTLAALKRDQTKDKRRTTKDGQTLFVLRPSSSVSATPSAVRSQVAGRRSQVAGRRSQVAAIGASCSSWLACSSRRRATRCSASGSFSAAPGRKVSASPAGGHGPSARSASPIRSPGI